MITVTASKIVSFAICTQCAWHQDKNKHCHGKHVIKPPVAVCASCRALTLTLVGRYIYEPFSAFFGLFKGQRVRGYTSDYRERCGL